MHSNCKAIGNTVKSNKDRKEMKISKKGKEGIYNIYCIDCKHSCSQPVNIIVVRCCLKNRDNVSAV